MGCQSYNDAAVCVPSHLLGAFDKLDGSLLVAGLRRFPLLHLPQRLIHNVRLRGLELPGWDSSLKQLVDLLQRAALQLGQKEEEEEGAEKV